MFSIEICQIFNNTSGGCFWSYAYSKYLYYIFIITFIIIIITIIIIIIVVVVVVVIYIIFFTFCRTDVLFESKINVKYCKQKTLYFEIIKYILNENQLLEAAQKHS